MWECQVCQLVVQEPHLCVGCAAMAYCGHWHARVHRDQMGHADECARMREQMGRGPQLADTGLAYSQLLTQDRSPAASSVCSLLQQLHAHRQGPFLQLCTCTTDVSPSPGHWQSAGAKHLDQYQDYSAGSAGPAPPHRGESPAQGPTAAAHPESWREWCAQRSLGPETLLPLVFAPAATLSYGMHRLRQRYASCAQLGRAPDLHVAVLGAEQEALWPQLISEEVLRQWPCVRRLRVSFVGPNLVPQPLPSNGGDWNGADAVDRQVRLDFLPECFHDACDEAGCLQAPMQQGCKVTASAKAEESPSASSHGLSQPDVVFLPNAGLAAYTSWEPTLRLLQELQVPMITTDYCEEAALRAVQAAAQISQAVMEVEVNPFRCPLRVQQTDNLLPSYSHGFVLFSAPS